MKAPDRTNVRLAWLEVQNAISALCTGLKDLSEAEQLRRDQPIKTAAELESVAVRLSRLSMEPYREKVQRAAEAVPAGSDLVTAAGVPSLAVATKVLHALDAVISSAVHAAQQQADAELDRALAERAQRQKQGASDANAIGA